MPGSGLWYEGRIKSWQSSRKFGFIESPDIPHEILLHRSEARAASEVLRIGAEIRFQLQENTPDDKPKACRAEGLDGHPIPGPEKKERQHRKRDRSPEPAAREDNRRQSQHGSRSLEDVMFAVQILRQLGPQVPSPAPAPPSYPQWPHSPNAWASCPYPGPPTALTINPAPWPQSGPYAVFSAPQVQQPPLLLSQMPRQSRRHCGTHCPRSKRP